MADDTLKYFSRSVVGIDAATGGESDPIEIPLNKALTIQQTGTATGTATIEVSSKGDVWTEFDPLSTAYDFASPIVIQDGHFPWRFLHVVVLPGGSGATVFEIQQRL